MFKKDYAVIVMIFFSILTIVGTTIILNKMYLQHEENERTIEQCIAQLNDIHVSSIEMKKKYFAGPIQCQIKP